MKIKHSDPNYPLSLPEILIKMLQRWHFSNCYDPDYDPPDILCALFFFPHANLSVICEWPVNIKLTLHQFVSNTPTQLSVARRDMVGLWFPTVKATNKSRSAWHFIIVFGQDSNYWCHICIWTALVKSKRTHPLYLKCLLHSNTSRALGIKGQYASGIAIYME